MFCRRYFHYPVQKFNCPGAWKNLDLVKLIGMKKIIACRAVAFSTLVFLVSCTKSSSDNFDQNARLAPDRIIESRVAPGQTQIVTIENYGELSIARQASHFKISHTGVDAQSGSLIYKYEPAEGFTGSDEVLLAHKIPMVYGSGSSSCNSGDQSKTGIHTSYIAVKIKVAAN